MKKLILFLLLTILFSNKVIVGQPVEKNSAGSKSNHEYYLYIKGVNTKSDVTLLEKIVGEQKGVTYFMANRFPVRYFQLKSERIISTEEFASWITGRGYALSFLGEGSRGLEQILIERKKAQ